MSAAPELQGEKVEDRVRYLLRRRLGAWGYGFDGEILAAKTMVEPTVFEQLVALGEYVRWRDEGGSAVPMDDEHAARTARGLEVELANMPNTADATIAGCRRRKRWGMWLQFSGLVIFALSCAYLYKHLADLAILIVAAGGTFAGLIGWGISKDESAKLRGVEYGFTKKTASTD